MRQAGGFEQGAQGTGGGVEFDEFLAGGGDGGDARTQTIEVGRAGEGFELGERQVVVVAEVQGREDRVHEVTGEGGGETRLGPL